jgi:hypothetical protein
MVSVADRINIRDRVELATGKDTIQGAKSFQMLDAVPGILTGRRATPTRSGSRTGSGPCRRSASRRS